MENEKSNSKTAYIEAATKIQAIRKNPILILTDMNTATSRLLNVDDFHHCLVEL